MISAILHTDHAGLIGINGELAYRSKEDFKSFKKYTSKPNTLLVMGRRTYQECGNLPGRNILTLSSKGNLLNGQPTDITIENCKEDLILCGGATVYNGYLHLCQEVVINFTKQECPPLLGVYTYFDLDYLNRLFTLESCVHTKDFVQAIYKKP